MSAHVLMNLLNKLGKRDKMRACLAFYLFFTTSFKGAQWLDGRVLDSRPSVTVLCP